jgi:hypothetical protein
MTESERPIPPAEQADVEYSGPYEGDERDPKLIGDITPGVVEEIRWRSAYADLMAARARVLRLGEERMSGSITDAEYRAEVAELTRLEEKYRLLPHPEE